MLKIYAVPISLYCAKLRIVLRHKSIQWQEILPPGGYGSREYKMIVPSGNLPALLDEGVEGGLLLGDSEAIAEYLNEKYPDPPMLPPVSSTRSPESQMKKISKRAKLRELSRFHDTRLEPELRLLFAHIRPRNRDLAVVEKQYAEISLRLGQLASMLAAAELDAENDSLMLADCGYGVSFEWIEQLTPILDLEIDWPERVLAYRDGLVRHRAVGDEIADYRPKLRQYLFSQGSS